MNGQEKKHKKVDSSIKTVNALCPDCLIVRQMAFSKGKTSRFTWCMWCKKPVTFKEVVDL